jgi:hypothetical protein
MISRILFLDVDGVLNHIEWAERRPDRRKITNDMNEEDVERIRAEYGFDPVCVEHLSTLVERAGCDIVISSTWRKMGLGQSGHLHMQRMLTHRGFKYRDRIIGSTPVLDRMVGSMGLLVAQPRGLEIQAWLDAHESVSNFVILDDESDMAHLSSRLVQTNYNDGGLRVDHVHEVVDLFEGSSG